MSVDETLHSFNSTYPLSIRPKASLSDSTAARLMVVVFCSLRVLLSPNQNEDLELLVADFGRSHIFYNEKFHALTTTCGTPEHVKRHLTPFIADSVSSTQTPSF